MAGVLDHVSARVASRAAEEVGPVATALGDYWPRAYRFAAMITRNDAEAADIAQEALLRAWHQAGTYDQSRGSFESWLWRIVLNTARDAGRAARRRHALWDRLRTLHSRTLPDAEEIALQRIDDDILRAEICRLPRQPRTIIALRFGGHLSYREIGAQIGVSEAAALMATRRALATLRAQLKAKEKF